MTTLIDIPDYNEAQREENRRRSGIEYCLVCGKGMSQAKIDAAWFVHMTTGGELAHIDDELEEIHDQGWWPVGADCAKRIPKTHRTKF
jgi:hypothetical protein